MDITKLSDQALHNHAKHIGGISLKYRRKFIGLIPEIYERRLYRKYKMASIFEYAAKIGGIGSETTKKVITLDQKLEDKPLIRKELQKGEIGWTKIRLIAQVATPKTQSKWIENARNLSQKSLNELTKQIKQNDKGIDTFFDKTKQLFSIQLHQENINKLKVYKTKSHCQDWDQTIHHLFTDLKNKTPETKRQNNPKKPQQDSRHIPILIKDTVIKRSKSMCEYPNCKNPGTDFHHTTRWIENPTQENHKNIKLLCKLHHELAHNGLILNEKKIPNEWKLSPTPNKNESDKLFLKIRKNVHN